MSLACLTTESLCTTQRHFEATLPQIDRVLRHQFRHLAPRQRGEAIADARAAAWHAWYGLVRRGQDPLAIGPTGIAANACRYVRNGRRLGCGSTGRGSMDVYHPRAQRRCGFQLISLDRHIGRAVGPKSDAWREWPAESNRFTPADVACFRLDFATWLAGLPERKQQMANLLVLGHETSVVAKMLGVTPAAVSLTRSWLARSWDEFQREAEACS
jgi:hypothetical protein